ncbi:MAG: hypothetical protein FJ088_03225 [Deltaproteobacteria bacterium]|nr:hypothetical protein [Deltaproteobacteria bacterium]
MNSAPAATVAFFLFFLSACPVHTDWNGTRKITDYTAYTLNEGEARAGVGVVGTG